MKIDGTKTVSLRAAQLDRQPVVLADLDSLSLSFSLSLSLSLLLDSAMNELIAFGILICISILFTCAQHSS